MDSPLAQPASAPGEVQWKDFDKQEVFEDTRQNAAAESCRNFVLEFGALSARIARNLAKAEFDSILSQPKRTPGYPIRWINIWDTSSSKDIVKAVGGRYNFSQRLINLMIYATELQQPIGQGEKKRKKKAAGIGTATAAASVATIRMDEEKALTDGSSAKSPIEQQKSVHESLESEEFELFRLLKNTVNYWSIDHTAKALCIGAHWLYKLPSQQAAASLGDEEKRIMPPKHWLWLVLCDDHTVITFHERPQLPKAPAGWDSAQWHREHYRNMRANSLNVLLQQSKLGMEMYAQRPLAQNHIRQTLARAAEEGNTSSRPGINRVDSDVAPVAAAPDTTLEDEGTSSLFYYLFEDYSAAGPLKAAGDIMKTITPLVLRSAERRSKVKSRDIIRPLHTLNTDLRTLTHLFENYKLMIGKIIAATRRPGNTALDRHVSHVLAESNPSESLIMSSDPERKAFLTASALQRFDRLHSRLDGIMLKTIEGHFEEIKALQDTYFNLTQQKDSNATARLNRSAALLAKLSVFFLPISFITSYFSIQVQEIFDAWTAEMYYYTFAVTITVSFLLMFFFGKLLMLLSDTLDDAADRITESLRKLFRAALKAFGMAPAEDEEEEEEEEY